MTDRRTIGALEGRNRWGDPTGTMHLAIEVQTTTGPLTRAACSPQFRLGGQLEPISTTTCLGCIRTRSNIGADPKTIFQKKTLPNPTRNQP